MAHCEHHVLRAAGVGSILVVEDEVGDAPPRTRRSQPMRRG